jgi:hypothetical protein
MAFSVRLSDGSVKEYTDSDAYRITDAGVLIVRIGAGDGSTFHHYSPNGWTFLSGPEDMKSSSGTPGGLRIPM